MIFVAHRGNISGPNKEEENKPDYIQKALDLGYDVEIDVWAKDELWLGHDEPQYQVPLKFLFKNFNKLWIHCKNLEAMDLLGEFKVLNYFWHESDDFALTSKNFIWTYPGKRVSNKSVLVVDDARNYGGPPCFGLCSDYFL
jgi:hypothetical protein